MPNMLMILRYEDSRNVFRELRDAGIDEPRRAVV
jgi:hypothetical protein